MSALADLKARLLEVDDLGRAAALLDWDQKTTMPPGGGAARGRQLATLSRLAHERFTDAAVGRLLDQLERPGSLPAGSDDAALVALSRRLYEQASRVPASLVAASSEHNAATYEAWTRARPANDFATMRPLLERSLDFSRQRARCASRYESLADPLIAVYDHGIRASEVRALFAALRARLVPLLRAVTAREPPSDALLREHAPAGAQLAFGREVTDAFGFDLGRGRLDLTTHPFMTKMSLGDVRITTRVREDLLVDTLFSTLHEAGHGLYAQGVRREFEGTPLADAPSAGLDESQSRLWENHVGRSLQFWEHFYPRLQHHVPGALGRVDLDTFYRAVHRVERSLIRTEADELTYDLHVMLRFDLEVDLLEGRLEVKDLPGAWRTRFQTDLGVEVPDDRGGVLQDVHWYSAGIGGEFQGYTLGNLMAAQLHAAAHPEIPREIAAGQFATLRGWLTEHVYQHGSRYAPFDLLARATGSGLSIDPYMDYLGSKYGRLYGVGERW